MSGFARSRASRLRSAGRASIRAVSARALSSVVLSPYCSETERRGIAPQRQLRLLLRRDRHPVGEVVELLDLVDGGEVRTAELREPTSKREPGARSPDETGIDERGADIRHRRFRQAQPASQVAEWCRGGRLLGEGVENR